MNKQKNQLLVLIGVVFLGFMYSYIQFFFLPQWGELQAVSVRISEREAYLQRLQENHERLPVLKENVDELEVQEGELRDVIPQELDYPDIMMTVYSLAKDNGLTPINLSYEGVKEDGQTVTMGMSFSCTGPRENIHNLIDQFLKGNEYIFALQSISYSDSQEGVSANMKLTAYTLRI